MRANANRAIPVNPMNPADLVMTTEQHGNPRSKPNLVYPRHHRQGIPILRSELNAFGSQNWRPLIQDHISPPKMKPPNSDRNLTYHAYKMDTTIWSDISEPQNYQDAINDPIYGTGWELAIKEEYESLMKNGAWELVELPPRKNLVTCKWVFKSRHNANGNVVRFKARLVARGFSEA